MKSGALVHRVVFDEPSDLAQDESGDVRPAWTPYAEVPASIEPLKGREIFSGDRVMAEVDTRIRVRWQPGLDAVEPKWRARFGDLVYDIRSVSHIGLRYREIEFMCRSGTSES